MSVDLVPGDTVSASFTSLSMLTLFLPALLLISPIKSAFTHPCSSSVGKGMERVRVCSWAAIGQAGQVNRKRVERGGLRRTRGETNRTFSSCWHWKRDDYGFLRKAALCCCTGHQPVLWVSQMTFRLVAYLKQPKFVAFGFSNIASLLLSLVLLSILSATNTSQTRVGTNPS